MKPILELRNINKSYKTHHVLKDVSFEINPGEIVGFIGSNGAGKSTTMKAICNLIQIDSGEIVVNGHAMAEDALVCLKDMSCLIEAPGLYPDLSGRQNITFFASLRNVSKENVEEVLRHTNLGHHLDRKVRTYSTGMRQKIGLSIALLSNPKLIILDEPMSGLDVDAVMELRKTIETIRQQFGTAILLSSHQLGEVEKMADRYIFIKDGEIVPDISIAQSKKTSIFFQDTTQLPDDLKRHPFYCDGLSISWTDESVNLNDVLRTILGQGLVIETIETTQRELEDIYRDVVGNHND